MVSSPYNILSARLEIARMGCSNFFDTFRYSFSSILPDNYVPLTCEIIDDFVTIPIPTSKIEVTVAQKRSFFYWFYLIPYNVIEKKQVSVHREVVC